jgi:hypothetical protein
VARRRAPQKPADARLPKAIVDPQGWQQQCLIVRELLTKLKSKPRDRSQPMTVADLIDVLEHLPFGPFWFAYCANADPTMGLRPARRVAASLSGRRMNQSVTCVRREAGPTSALR